MCIGWPWPGASISYGPESQRITIQYFDKSIGYLTAIIKPFVNDQSFFLPLRIELPDQFILHGQAAFSALADLQGRQDAA